MMVRTTRALAVAAATSLALIAGTAAASAPTAGDPRIVGGPEPYAEVVGGTPADEGEYPWVVRLSMGCGGSMLTDRIVLTAAHCVGETGPDASIVAVHGSVDLRGADVRRYRSSRIHTSPTYGRDATGDWALILLERAVPGATTLPIASDGRLDGGPFEIMGWGSGFEGGPQQRYLLKAEVPLIDDVDCRESYGDELDPATMLCAGYPQGGVDSCQGDSGGPMIARRESGEAVQVGIVSWGYGCARPGYPGVYAQLSALEDEIRSAVADLEAVSAPSTA